MVGDTSPSNPRISRSISLGRRTLSIHSAAAYSWPGTLAQHPAHSASISPIHSYLCDFYHDTPTLQGDWGSPPIQRLETNRRYRFRLEPRKEALSDQPTDWFFFRQQPSNAINGFSMTPPIRNMSIHQRVENGPMVQFNKVAKFMGDDIRR